MARYKFTEHDFQQLKYFFDQNDLYGGANWLNQMMEMWIEDAFTESYQGEVMYNLPFKTDFPIDLKQPSELNNINPGTYHDKPVIGLSDEVLQTLDLVFTLQERIDKLEHMHSNEGGTDHIPTIISTKEQYEEMKPQMDEKERVLVHTTFDKALSVL